MTHWIFLSGAITAEVLGTISLKLSNGFEHVIYVVPTLILYSLSFWLLAFALKGIELSVAYAIWGGLGIAIVALIGVAVFNESLNLVKVLCLLAIIAGVVGLHISTNPLPT